jgi:hypothetical protein
MRLAPSFPCVDQISLRAIEACAHAFRESTLRFAKPLYRHVVDAAVAVVTGDTNIVDTEGAPIVFFDGIETWASTAGDIGHLTLIATRHLPNASTVSMTAAHLRFPLAVLPLLREAIEKLELVAAKPMGRS